MLQFYSANVRGANTARVLDQCVENAFQGNIPKDLRAVIVYVTMGHKLEKVNAYLHTALPGAFVLGCTCGGIVGPNGVGESMNEIGIFAISGPAEEVAYASISDVSYQNTAEKAEALAKELQAKLPGINAACAIVPGLDCAIDGVVQGFDSVLKDVPLFGGVASDNMKGITSYQLHDGKVGRHGMWMVGFADPTLSTVNRATHGFTVIGEPMEVTASEGVRILELDGKNAWEVYTARTRITQDASITELMPFGAVAEELPEESWAEYGSKYLLHGLARKDNDGALVYRAHFNPGTKLRLAIRDEALIFSEIRRILDEMRGQADGEFVAALQSDCIIRGRFSLDAISKDELAGMMQNTLARDDGSKAAWLGMYGFGEFVPLCGQNQYHTFTTSLMAIYRRK
ncbi:MAG: FIST C-terminal domain-containing protein [Clostridia bacterium]|nr:FIST C-terminal domain-containing protein [Clostridia bacterium]